MLAHTRIRTRLLLTVKPSALCLPIKSICAARPAYRPNTLLISVGRPTARPFVCSAALPGGNIVDLEHLQLPILSGMLDSGEQYALLLSTLAGLSTSIGGAIAIVKKPGNDLLSFLLGIAIGVMATLSVLEMWLHNAAEHGVVGITAAAAAGVALYYVAQPYFPDFVDHQQVMKHLSWMSVSVDNADVKYDVFAGLFV